MRLSGRRAQSASEYAVVLTTLTLVFSTMSIYLRRSLQAAIKRDADAFNISEGVVQNGELMQRDGILQETRQDQRFGRIVAQQTKTASDQQKLQRKNVSMDGTQVTRTGAGYNETRIWGRLGPGGKSSYGRTVQGVRR